MKDANSLFKLIDSDRKRLGKFLPFVALMKTVRDQKKFLDQQQEHWRDRTKFSYGIFRADDGVLMGAITAHSFRWAHDSLEFGYWIGGVYEGYGYVSEAVQALARAAFAMKFHRIEIRCDTKNQKSRDVTFNCGFKSEGVLRGIVKIGTSYFDIEVFSLLASDVT